MTLSSNCKQCGNSTFQRFFQLPPVPTMDGVMCSTLEAAENVVKGEIDLHFCNNCGFIGNKGHDKEKVRFEDYDFSNDQSPTFRAFVNDLIERLTTTHHLKNKTVLDIGCGDGVFLEGLSKKGNNYGIGIDPGFDHSKRKPANGIQLKYIQDHYSEKYSFLKPDFVACRHVLNVLSDQTGFIKMLRKNLENLPETIVYFEVPNALHTFEDKVIWNVAYEHGAWFTRDSLTYLFESCGFEVINLSECWNDEFLGIEVRPKPHNETSYRPKSQNIKSLAKTIQNFSEDFQELKGKSEKRIEKIQSQHIKTIAWGAGARAVTFFNLFNVKTEVPFIIDINSKRHDKYLPGSGQQIVAPEFIQNYQPDLVIITNPTYEEEIKTHVFNLGIQPDFWVL